MKKIFKTLMAVTAAVVMSVSCISFTSCLNLGTDSSSSSEATVTYKVKFDVNYSGGKDERVNVAAGQTVTAPEVTRSGYIFDAWYTDKEGTTPFDFSTAITEDLTLYAIWYEEGTEMHTVTYNYNYDNKVEKKSIVSGKRLTLPTVTRDGYEILGWYSDEACTQAFTSGTKVSADLNLYVKWGQVYVLEAEYVDLTGFSGQGFSGGCDGVQAIAKDKSGLGASNGVFLTYMYNMGLSVTFNFTSDKAVDNAKIILRLSCEIMDISFTSNEFSVSLNNGGNLSYSDISLTKDQQFQDFVVGVNCSLNEGANTLRLTTTNSRAMAGTMYATAPIIDCVKIVSESVIVMDAKTSNMDKFNQD